MLLIKFGEAWKDLLMPNTQTTQTTQPLKTPKSHKEGNRLDSWQNNPEYREGTSKQ